MTRRDQTLRAWIERESPRRNWISCISHKGVTHRRTTPSRIRKAALEFSLLHIADVIRPKTTTTHSHTHTELFP